MCIRDRPLRELAYLPKGVMDPHDILPNDARVGRLPDEVYDWMKSEVNDRKDSATNPNN